MNTHCNHKFIRGKREGQICGTYIRKKNDKGKCAVHIKCPHGKRERCCFDCGGKQACKHKKETRICRLCNGGGICEHKKRRYDCQLCNGGGICIHLKHLFQCKDCNFELYILSIVNRRIYHGYESVQFERKTPNILYYLGCGIKMYLDYLNEKLGTQDVFKDEIMHWDNYGSYWQIDHIIPLYFEKDKLTEEQFIKRFHYSNTQPLSKKENFNKKSKFIG
tara:strand:+ start:993 stop:1652 length:660 start_codon:yes stop_codon:yes gene_type:complete